MATKTLVVVVLAAIVFVQARSESRGDDRELDQKVARILKAEDAWEAGRGYRELFRLAGAEGLKKLKKSPHDSIALQAAWEEVVLTVPEKEGKRKYRVDRAKLNWFLGFLEGRTRFQLPEWWKQSILNCGAHHRGNIFPGDLKNDPYHNVGPRWIRVPRDTTISKVGKGYVLRVGSFWSFGKRSIRLPDELLSRTGDGELTGHFSAAFTRDRCYLAIHSDSGFSYTLACVDCSSNKVLWKSIVWDTPRRGVMGVHQECVAVTVQDKRVVVFGISSMNFHVEAFRESDGKNLFRLADNN